LVQVRLLACEEVIDDHDIVACPDIPITTFEPMNPAPPVTRIFMKASAFF